MVKECLAVLHDMNMVSIVFRIFLAAACGCSTIISVRLPRSRNSDEIVELLSVEKYVKVVRFINETV